MMGTATDHDAVLPSELQTARDVVAEVATLLHSGCACGGRGPCPVAPLWHEAAKLLADAGLLADPAVTAEVERLRARVGDGYQSTTNAQIWALSDWIDAGNEHRDPEAVTWGRLAKVSEEAGEVIAAYIGLTGQNPRKGVTHSLDDVSDELLDVAITALAALAHLRPNAFPLDLLAAKVERVAIRAGVTPSADEATP